MFTVHQVSGNCRLIGEIALCAEKITLTQVLIERVK